ncbi:MAG: phospholipase D family protein [Tenuifilaceae bacterium]|jgi:HKD family nuclease|nr:phospholipase D family protein [Tenuifilaceae bacterium]
MSEAIILDKTSFASEFERCCNQYTSLKMAIAWCGDPSHILPYSYLTSTENKMNVEIIVGVTFNQTHPDAIQYFLDNGIGVRIFKVEINLFHPKFYLFKVNNKFALFVGSSNFTYSGFYNNTEINSLSENDNSEQIHNIESLFSQWQSDNYSFVPGEKWLKKYRKAYRQQRSIERKNKITTPRDNEESISTSNWLTQANWKLYLHKVNKGLSEKERDKFGYSAVLDAAQTKLPLPWDITIFDQIENRRIIGGMGKYGWLGHVAASGTFRQFMANGSRANKRAAVAAINNICGFMVPLNLKILAKELNKLTQIGPTIKVWSRILTILRPDIFCTVASTSVRENLSKTLQMPKSHFETVEGYIGLLELIHSCPWYISARPVAKKETKIWDRRAAFMDAIFY